MKISTRGKNALKFMLDLATYSRGQPVRLKDIARRQHISESRLFREYKKQLWCKV